MFISLDVLLFLRAIILVVTHRFEKKQSLLPVFSVWLPMKRLSLISPDGDCRKPVRCFLNCKSVSHSYSNVKLFLHLVPNVGSLTLPQISEASIQRPHGIQTLSFHLSQTGNNVVPERYFPQTEHYAHLVLLPSVRQAMIMAPTSNLIWYFVFLPVWLHVLLCCSKLLLMLLCLHWNRISILYQLPVNKFPSWFSSAIIKHCEQKNGEKWFILAYSFNIHQELISGQEYKAGSWTQTLKQKICFSVSHGLFS